MAERNAAHFQVLNGGQQKDARAEGTELPDLAFLIKAGHELHGAAVDIAGAGDLDVARAVGRDDALDAFHVRHVIARVDAGQKFGVVGQVEIDSALQRQRPHQILLPAAHQHLSSARGRRRVDRLLDRPRVQCLTIAHRAVVPRVEGLLPGAVLRT